MKKLQSIILASILATAMPASAQSSDWKPTGTWPFLNKQFRVATVYTGIFKKTKTQVPCNIHVGSMALWYTQNDTLLEAVPGSVVYVEFPNGDTYMPFGSDNRFGRIVRQDTINGRVARVIHMRTVDQHKLDKKYQDLANNTQNLLQGDGGGILPAGFLENIASANGGTTIEEEPLPMTDEYLFQLNGEVFPAKTSEILTRINPKRRKEYKTYTRTAEIISHNESSILRIWNDFFINYDDPVLDKNMEWIKKYGK